MKKFLMLIAGFLTGIILTLNCIGFIVGDFIYRELKQPHLYQSLFSLADNSRKLDKIATAEAANGWEKVYIDSPYGYSLCGTFIPAAENIGTVIIVHGLFQNRSTGLDYYSIYHDMGYNVLLADSRAHGESGGSSISWGYFEKHDLDAWVKWVKARQPGGSIGIHGISMGASTAALHSSLNEASHNVDFYIIDSAYDDFGSLLEHQLSLLRRPNGSSLLNQAAFDLSLPNIMLFYIQAAAYYEDRIKFADISPLTAVRAATAPMLFLHGDADTLIPKTMSANLAAALNNRQNLRFFPESPHASSVYKDRRAYSDTIKAFISQLPKRLT